MQHMLRHIKINEGLFTKNPDSSKLGHKIISQSIEMIDELGFEAFTFRKLGVKIGSNESSIYRYFESKHALLVYSSVRLAKDSITKGSNSLDRSGKSRQFFFVYQ